MQKLFTNKFILWLALSLLLAGCNVRSSKKDSYQDLFIQIQMQQVFSDSKTFLDCVALIPEDSITILYNLQRDKSGFNLKAFVTKNYQIPTLRAHNFVSDTTLQVSEHISKLWSVLTRRDSLKEGTLIPLPHPYVVPGGRFNEIYYWDSYFTMLGLKADGQNDLIESMVNNFASLIRNYGFIPNGNREYFLTRSQPPFFSLMVELLATIKSDSIIINYLPELKKEYLFWMKGWEELTELKPARNHVVFLNEKQYLNRYWDMGDTPRPESFREDSLLTLRSDLKRQELYRNIRSACESGWDFSSRWLADQQSLETIETTSIIPVDLNVLLWNLENVIAKGCLLANEAKLSKEFKQKADVRKELIRKVFWNKKTKFFMDYNFKEKKHTPSYSLAGVFPLFAGLASREEAKLVAQKIKDQFLFPYGLVTTLKETGQQWDYPNGWAPLQWITIKGLQNYEFHNLAEKSARRWIQSNVEGYRITGKLVEKYNVVNGFEGKGGEYPTQDGFGWTNGVLQMLIREYPIPVHHPTHKQPNPFH